MIKNDPEKYIKARGPAAEEAEKDRLLKALELSQRVNEQDRRAHHMMSDVMTDLRSRNRALRNHIADLVEENSKLRLALANAQHGDV